MNPQDKINLLNNAWTTFEMSESEKLLALYDLKEGSLSMLPEGLALAAHNIGVTATRKGIYEWLNS
jgi:hypothetical protein